jgi:hypothetical protein
LKSLPIQFNLLSGAIILFAPSLAFADDSIEIEPRSSLIDEKNQAEQNSRVLSGSAKSSQPLKSSVKLLTRTSPLVKGQIERPSGVCPNVLAFNRIHHLTADGKALPMRSRETRECLAAINRNSTDDIKILEPPPVEDVASQDSTNGVMDWTKRERTKSKHTEQLSARLSPGKFPKPPELRSTAHLLTEGDKPLKRSVNWDEWYRRVCQTIYDQWLLNGTGPGIACVSVTVWPSRDIEGRIMNIEYAADARKDGATQTAFANSALRAVHSLGGCSLLDFPLGNPRDKITFQLDITRLVGGESGYEVINRSE